MCLLFMREALFLVYLMYIPHLPALYLSVGRKRTRNILFHYHYHHGILKSHKYLDKLLIVWYFRFSGPWDLSRRRKPMNMTLS